MSNSSCVFLPILLCVFLTFLFGGFSLSFYKTASFNSFIHQESNTRSLPPTSGPSHKPKTIRHTRSPKTEFIIFEDRTPGWWPAHATPHETSIPCPGTNRSYLITSNKTHLPNASHYVVWIRFWNRTNVERLRKKYPGMVFVWYTKEGPHADRDQLDPEVMSLFDLGWSYRRADDIWQPYGSARWYTEALMQHPIDNIEAEFKGRKDKVFFLQSNCNGYDSRFRTKIATELQRVGLLDSFGKCIHSEGLPSVDGDICDHAKHYKFYFALENQYASDYITEKIKNGFRCGTIPIVYSSEGVPEYDNILPHGSYIDISQFDTFEQLKQHLLEVSSDLEKYRELLSWRLGDANREQAKSLWKAYFAGSKIMHGNGICQLIESHPHVQIPDLSSRIGGINSLVKSIHESNTAEN